MTATAPMRDYDYGRMYLVCPYLQRWLFSLSGKYLFDRLLVYNNMLIVKYSYPLFALFIIKLQFTT